MHSVEGKVWAAFSGSGISGVIAYLLTTHVFTGLPPDLKAFLPVLFGAGGAWGGGFTAKHTPRLQEIGIILQDFLEHTHVPDYAEQPPLITPNLQTTSVASGASTAQLYEHPKPHLVDDLFGPPPNRLRDPYS